ncbi:family 78 glycoside hydrolase catalytic domain [Ningiella sp. W23]|uniref:family 78 glycoside hydrolase catalytic domain n=1 Tax=Ningiella sp. W23 TaxID=3023715 RepID=UPI003757B9B5
MQNSQHLVQAPIKLSVGEGFYNPIGYYEPMPRFSWKIHPESLSQSQSAYQIQVASNMFDKNSADIWDSKKTLSAETSWIKYEGKALSSRQGVYWRVRFWDEQMRVSNWSKPQSIEMGLLNNQQWQGKWIRHPEANESYVREYEGNIVKNALYRPQYLRTEFRVKPGVKKARLYITSKGVFTSFINGTKVSADVMTPGWTPYLKRIETLTYDVTSLLTDGQNALAAIVAEGWHTGRILSPEPREVKPSALLLQLEIEYLDGSSQTISTDKNWKASIKGPIRLASNYDGETYDENYKMPGWKLAGFDQENWLDVITDDIESDLALQPKRHTAPTTKAIIDAIDIIAVDNPQAGVVVFDMGQNMLGVPEVHIPALANQKITIRFAEALEHNRFYTKNLRSALATDYYIPAKSGIIHYIPTFTFHGYRYVEISGYDQTKTPDLSWVKGRVQHSDFDVTASFASSHNKLNKLSENIVWGLRGNFLDIPTDCPQRDERLGWTGDAQVFSAPSMYMADVYGFWSAWMQSIREEQDTNGRIPNFVPTKQNKHTKGASSGWGDVAIIVPYELYQLTGDTQILAENYTMMKGWLDFHQSNANKHISSMDSFQDWLQPHSQRTGKWEKLRGDTPRKLISTAYYARALDYISRSARVLGLEQDANQYSEEFRRVKKAFRETFYDNNLMAKTSSTQTSYLLPLAFDLFSVEDAKKAQQHLLDEIARADNHLRTGFLGTPLLAPVLQKIGRSDLMYEILFKESYPSWFYSINNGATTTWERWDSYSLTDGFSDESMNSLNHYAYGAVAKWFYEGILGIRPSSPGFKTITIEPQFTTHLSHAKGGYMTPQGEVIVDWKIHNSQLSMQVVVPKNTSATIVLPEETYSTLRLNRHSLVSANALVNLAPGSYDIAAKLDL